MGAAMLDAGVLLWLAAAAAAAALLWLWLLRPLSHWQRLGVPFEPGYPFFGNYFRVLTQRISAGEVLAEIYKKNEDKAYVGVYQFGEPAILVRDPDLVRAILVKDFAHFQNNVFPVDKDLDPLLAKNPFVLTGEEWKASRHKLTSTFSSSRIRNMLPLIAEVCDAMLKYVRNEGPSSMSDGMDVKELASRFTTDSVASVAFSVQANCFEDPNAEVRLMNRQLMEPTGLRMLQLTLQIFLPWIAKIIHVRMVPLEVDRYFRRLVRDAVDYRERTGVQRADFLQMLLQIRQKSQEAGDASYGEEEMTAHALSFFADGFETSSVALSLLLHDLAHSPADQERLRAELRALDPAEHEAVLHAPFLNACLQGMRFAQAQVKMGAAALVRHFAVRLTPRSPPNPPPLNPASFLYGAKGGLWLNFHPLDDDAPAPATAV